MHEVYIFAANGDGHTLYCCEFSHVWLISWFGYKRHKTKNMQQPIVIVQWHLESQRLEIFFLFVYMQLIFMMYFFKENHVAVLLLKKIFFFSTKKKIFLWTYVWGGAQSLCSNIQLQRNVTRFCWKFKLPWASSHRNILNHSPISPMFKCTILFLV